MPLSILLPLVVLGIAGIAAMLHLLGYSQTAEIADEDAARRLWVHHFPDDRPRHALLAHDRHAALVDTDRGLGLVWGMGADTVARLLHGADATPCGAGLNIHLHDFSAPSVTLTLTPSEVRDWTAAIERSTT